MDIGFHRDCTATLKRKQAELGVDVDIFVKPPKPPSLHLEQWRCPHNVVYWYQPSMMQLERWKRAGTSR